MQISNVNNKYFTTTNDINILKEDAIKYIQEEMPAMCQYNSI